MFQIESRGVCREPLSAMIAPIGPSWTVVGNADLTDAERSEIRRRADGSTVVRFNDLTHAREGDKTDLHVVRLPSAWPPRFAVAAPKLYVTPCDRFLPDAAAPHLHAYESQYSSCARGPRRIFAACAACGDSRDRCLANATYAGPSTGAALLSVLQDAENVTAIHVFGMNWNGQPDVHIDFADPDLVRQCCTKCIIHPTSNSRYGTEWPAQDVIALAVAAAACAACAVCAARAVARRGPLRCACTAKAMVASVLLRYRRLVER